MWHDSRALVWWELCVGNWIWNGDKNKSAFLPTLPKLLVASMLMKKVTQASPLNYELIRKYLSKLNWLFLVEHYLVQPLWISSMSPLSILPLYKSVWNILRCLEAEDEKCVMMFLHTHITISPTDDPALTPLHCPLQIFLDTTLRVIILKYKSYSITPVEDCKKWAIGSSHSCTQNLFTTWLCCQFHQKVQSISPLP